MEVPHCIPAIHKHVTSLPSQPATFPVAPYTNIYFAFSLYLQRLPKQPHSLLTTGINRFSSRASHLPFLCPAHACPKFLGKNSYKHENFDQWGVLAHLLKVCNNHCGGMRQMSRYLPIFRKAHNYVNEQQNYEISHSIAAKRVKSPTLD